MSNYEIHSPIRLFHVTLKPVFGVHSWWLLFYERTKQLICCALEIIKGFCLIFRDSFNKKISTSIMSKLHINDSLNPKLQDPELFWFAKIKSEYFMTFLIRHSLSQYGVFWAIRRYTCIQIVSKLFAHEATYWSDWINGSNPGYYH